MFDHFGLFVTDFEKTISLYEACLAPLGIKISQRQPEFGAAIFSTEGEEPFLWVGTAPVEGDYHGTPLRKDSVRPIHIAFRAPSVDAVKSFHQIALENGGRCNGGPEDCGGNYFAAYILDPDGNNLEAGIRQAKP